MSTPAKRKRPIRFFVWLNKEEREELRRLSDKERLTQGDVVRVLIRDAARRLKRAA